MWRTIKKIKKIKKQTNKETKTYKHKEEQGRGILYKRNKETKTERVGLGFLDISMHAHT